MKSNYKIFLGPFQNPMSIFTIIISNSNWTRWSTIQGVIGRVISKSVEREAQGRFEITEHNYSLNYTTRSPIRYSLIKTITKFEKNMTVV